ncbi:hypothetical protein FEM03_02600 [Phragmitibacter flavus]|uniref:Uncharacterized protein n=1 Tax=Phragmitibacter flavus TaxID=2576071 RepID=A0A5R8KIX6_9BACT|nr:hypothetical protein [Phragmitibacter flavus]TLD72264.1 hypothetical protein FEM03_02600 [Phragmitibacter flavus]
MSPTEQQRFVSQAHSGHFTIKELCEEFGINRNAGHKRLVRVAEFGMVGTDFPSVRVPGIRFGLRESETDRMSVARTG